MVGLVRELKKAGTLWQDWPQTNLLLAALLGPACASKLCHVLAHGTPAALRSDAAGADLASLPPVSFAAAKAALLRLLRASRVLPGRAGGGVDVWVCLQRTFHEGERAVRPDAASGGGLDLDHLRLHLLRARCGLVVELQRTFHAGLPGGGTPAIVVHVVNDNDLRVFIVDDDVGRVRRDGGGMGRLGGGRGRSHLRLQQLQRGGEAALYRDDDGGAALLLDDDGGAALLLDDDGVGMGRFGGGRSHLRLHLLHDKPIVVGHLEGLLLAAASSNYFYRMNEHS